MEKKLTIEQLELLVWLGHIFRKGISNEWLQELSKQDVIMYPDGVIMTTVRNEVLYINSGTRANAIFSMSMKKKILELIQSSEKIILQASYRIPASIEKKLKLSYNYKEQFYCKGGEQWLQQH